MKRLLVAMLFAAAACRGQGSAVNEDDAQFLTRELRTTMSGTTLGGIAATRAKLAETRQLGADLQKDEAAYHDALVAIARQHNVAIPQLEDKRLALHENLAVLPGITFDKGYTLAMVQDTEEIVKSLDRATSSHDDAIRALAQRFKPVFAKYHDRANLVMSHMGGTPFVS